MRVLITSSRMPFALGMVRRLAGEGRAIYAADDYSLSSGSHSKHLAGHFVYPSPRSNTTGFLAELERIELTPALKVKRSVIYERYADTFDKLYTR